MTDCLLNELVFGIGDVFSHHIVVDTNMFIEEGLVPYGFIVLWGATVGHPPRLVTSQLLLIVQKVGNRGCVHN